MPLSAAHGVSQVMNRCEEAKVSGFLDLSDCSLMYIADAIYLVLKGSQITRCSLKGNNLKKFPLKMVANFPDMDVLNLDGNQLAELPPEIGDWHRLRGINVARNQLSAFPDPLFRCRELVLLDLSGNPIKELDPDRIVSAFPALKQLHLHECPLDPKVVQVLNAKLGPKGCQVVTEK